MHNRGLTLTTYAAAITLATLCGGAQAAGTVQILYGTKSLDSDWKPLESQSEFGFGVAYRQSEWPVLVVASYLTSEDSTTRSGLIEYKLDTYPATDKFTANTQEIGIGIRKNLSAEAIRLFIEGGLATISARLIEKLAVPAIGYDVSSTTSDSAIGVWFGAGLDVLVSEMVSIGASARISNATVRFPTRDPDTGAGLTENIKAGGTHFNVYAAYHFK
jgi:hypothetical protein